MLSLIPYNSINNDMFQLSKDGQNIPPGQLQYKITPSDINNISYLNEHDIDSLWIFQPHTKDNLEKLIPNTKTGNNSNWKIVFICL